MARRINKRYRISPRPGTLGDCRAVRSAKARIESGGGIPINEVPMSLPFHLPGGGDLEGWL